MKRLLVGVAAAAVAGGVAILACWLLSERSPRSPNLIVITVDTLRQDHLGCYGSDTKTTALDKLAAEGFRFQDSVAVAPTTLPSHTSLFTGLYPARHGVRLNGRFQVPAEAQTLAEVLRAHGYRTAAFVGAAVLSRHYALDQGFQIYNDDVDSDVASAQAQRRAADVSRAAIDWLESVTTPFFLWVHYFDPHGPYDPPPPYDSNYYEGNPRSPKYTSMEGISVVFYQKLDGITDIRYPLAQYKGEVTYTDKAVGQLLEAVDYRGFHDNTLVLMTADHGESLGENNYYFDHGETLHDTSMRVPLIIRAPWLEGAPRVVEGPVSLVDVYPTVLDLLDIEVPDGIQGQSVATYLEEGRVPDRELFLETMLPTISERSAIFGIQTAHWKLILRENRVKLFHRLSDPGEQKNVAEQHAVVRNWLVDLVQGYFRTQPLRAERFKPSPEHIEQLRALGYIQ
jgi:arylsulfatase A-like enzyme